MRPLMEAWAPDCVGSYGVNEPSVGTITKSSSGSVTGAERGRQQKWTSSSSEYK